MKTKTDKATPNAEQTTPEVEQTVEPCAEQTADETSEAVEQINEWEVKYTELNNNHLRLMAEFENYRKRIIREKADLIRNASERVLTDFLPIVDNFERALKSMEKADNVEAVREGVEMIYNQVMTMLKNNGVKPIETEGLELDTEFHDAIATFPAPSEELKGKIIDCTTKGYTLNDKVIRHAKVVVGQ